MKETSRDGERYSVFREKERGEIDKMWYLHRGSIALLAPGVVSELPANPTPDCRLRTLEPASNITVVTVGNNR